MINIQKLPKHFKYHGSSVLEVSRTNGHPILGLFIIGFSAFIILIGGGVIDTNPENISAEGQKILIGISLLIFMFGLYFGFWSSHAYIDKGRGYLFYKSGLFGLGKSTKHLLSDFDTIKRGFVAAADSDSNDLFPIQLIGKSTGKCSPILCQPYLLQNALEEINILSNFLQWPIMDMSLGPVAYITNPDQKPFTVIEKPTLSPTTKLVVKDMIGDITLTYPLPNQMGSAIISVSFPLIFIIFVFWDIFLRHGVYMAIFLLIWGLIILMIVKKYRKTTTFLNLNINSKELTLTKDKQGAKIITIPLRDIQAISLHANEDAILNSSNKIVIRTTSEQHEIAQFLTYDDTTYIYNMIRSHL